MAPGRARVLYGTTAWLAGKSISQKDSKIGSGQDARGGTCGGGVMVLHTQLVGAPELIPFSASSERRALQSLWGKQGDPAEYRVFRQQQGRAQMGQRGTSGEIEKLIRMDRWAAGEFASCYGVNLAVAAAKVSGFSAGCAVAPRYKPKSTDWTGHRLDRHRLDRAPIGRTSGTPHQALTAPGRAPVCATARSWSAPARQWKRPRQYT
jgi:hypothetical protein